MKTGATERSRLFSCGSLPLTIKNESPGRAERANPASYGPGGQLIGIARRPQASREHFFDAHDSPGLHERCWPRERGILAHAFHVRYGASCIPCVLGVRASLPALRIFVDVNTSAIGGLFLCLLCAAVERLPAGPSPRSVRPTTAAEIVIRHPSFPYRCGPKDLHRSCGKVAHCLHFCYHRVHIQSALVVQW